jgi:hypothetical protein
VTTTTNYAIGTRVGRWFVHGPAPVGVRDGAPLYRCTCLLMRRLHRTLTEAEYRALSAEPAWPWGQWECECPRAWPDDFIGWGWRTWTVLSFAGHYRRPGQPRKLAACWRCQCRCGTDQVFSDADISKRLACVCQPADSDAAKVEETHIRSARHELQSAFRRSCPARSRPHDRGWTKAMERLLRRWRHTPPRERHPAVCAL